MKIKKIESSSNSLYKKFLSLTKSAGVKDEQLCLVSGEKIINEFASKNKLDDKTHFWIFCSEEHSLFELHPQLQLILLPKELFKSLDVIGSHSPILCATVPEIKKWKMEDELLENELLCALGDPNNLGALLRSAKAFGVNKIVLLEECCHPFHPKCIKASSGASFGLKYFKGPSIQNLSAATSILALDSTGTELQKFNFKQKYRILLGEEGQGVPLNAAAEKVSIAMHPDVESLNATVAASLLMYHLSFQRSSQG